MNKADAKDFFMQVVVDGFVIAPNIIIKECDVLAAVVWGKIWSFSQMKDGKCSASLDKIAGLLGISYRTVVRRGDWLEKNEYIKDLTPDRRNAPHEYIPTNKIRPNFLFSIDSAGATESQTEVRQRVRPRYDRESVDNTIVNTPVKIKGLKDAKNKSASFNPGTQVSIDLEHVARNPKSETPKKTRVKNKSSEPVKTPEFLQPLMEVFEELAGRSAGNDVTYWCFGRASKTGDESIKGLVDFKKNNISAEAMRLAAKKCESDGIPISRPHTIFAKSLQIQNKLNLSAFTVEKVVAAKEEAIVERAEARRLKVVDGKVVRV